MPQNAFFSTNSQSSGQPKNDAKTLLFHPPSTFPIIFATATVVAFVLLRNSRFNLHCYTQREATPTQKSARKRRCDLSRLLARKITKGIHSCKPASLNRPTGFTQCYGLFRAIGWDIGAVLKRWNKVFPWLQLLEHWCRQLAVRICWELDVGLVVETGVAIGSTQCYGMFRANGWDIGSVLAEQGLPVTLAHWRKLLTVLICWRTLLCSLLKLS